MESIGKKKKKKKKINEKFIAHWNIVNHFFIK